MTTHFEEYSARVTQLDEAICALDRQAFMLQLKPLEGRDWFDLLRQKLVPQLRDDAFLVVAVVGGTNIGKSVVFNHLAGGRVSGTSPLASGTKHPVCLLPTGFRERHDLQAIFEGFKIEKWSSAEQSLGESDTDYLFWRESETLSDNMIVLDTPDIDSDAVVNWRRADNVRRCADVLVAVLTQQKYNDAAVKEFFRRASSEDKYIVVVFNQCMLPEDEDYWPLWLDTFCRETGTIPELLFLAPSDRKAAEENRLPFYERKWPIEKHEAASDSFDPRTDVGHNLADEIAELRFEEIKIRTLRGSLKHLANENHGIEVWLREIRDRSREFASAADRVSDESVAKVRDWPMVPNRLIVQEVRAWWKEHQEGWARRVHGFYDVVGKGVLFPVRFVSNQFRSDQRTPMEIYRDAEWDSILRSVEEVFDKLTFMSESSTGVLKPHLDKLLQGKSRSELVKRIRIAHENCDLEQDLVTVVHKEMNEFQTGSPELYRFYKQVQNLSAAVRPMTSVVLFTLGWGPAGELVAPMVTEAVTHAVVPIVVDFAGGAAAAVAGESAVSEAAGSGVGFMQAKLQRLQTRYVTRRVGWLAELLKEHLFGSLPEDLRSAALLPESDEFQQVTRLLDELRTDLHATPAR